LQPTDTFSELLSTPKMCVAAGARPQMHFSERERTICYRPSVCLSSVCL